jgi:hypothetical protein
MPFLLALRGAAFAPTASSYALSSGDRQHNPPTRHDGGRLHERFGLHQDSVRILNYPTVW